MALLIRQFPSKPPILDLASELIKKKKHIALCFINSTKGTFSKVGDSIAESNHASVCAHLGNYVAGNLEVIFLKLMDRHKHLSLRTNTHFTVI